MNNIIVTAAQISPVLGKVQENLEKHLFYIEEAKKLKSDIIIFPELSLTGYNLKDSALDVARNTESREVQAIAEASKGITTIFGLVELGFAAQIHNSSLAVRENKVLFLHRKLNLPNYGDLTEGKLFGTGRSIDTFKLQEQWFGSILICADVWNPGLVHLAAVSGATILTIPINAAHETVKHDLYSNSEGWDLMARFYSYIYGLPIVVVNRIGKESEFEFFGKSKIFGPHGEILSQAGSDKEEIITAELKFSEIVRARSHLPTVRDSNLDLIHRETVRLWMEIGKPVQK